MAATSPSTTPLDGTNAKAQQKRTSRACLACRSRKSRCNLDSQDGTGQPPCERCRRENKECVIGSSNRGGRRVRRSTLAKEGAKSSPAASSTGQWPADASPTAQRPLPSGSPNQAPFPAMPPPVAAMTPATHSSMQMQIDPSLSAPGPSGGLSVPLADVQTTSRSSSDDIPFNDLQNPSDALDILAHIASHGHNDRNQRDFSSSRPNPTIGRNGTNSGLDGMSNLLDYPPIRHGSLTVQMVSHLLGRYRQHYHAYLPLAPRSTLEPRNLAKTIVEEQHLLTAILVIASKDLVEESHIFKACSEHMQSLVSALAAGASGGVEAVEALLILATWTPYTSHRQAGQVGRGEEDREAWMHVGTALRISYFLGLDKYSFPVEDAKDPDTLRKRLVWTACYISDRQISIRIGRGFWSRGPGPLTTLRKEDFPSLQPQTPGEEDLATIFQATLELTMLFSNVHDVLYANPSGVRRHLHGGYIKYIDDFRSAIYGWNSVFGSLTCSRNMKAVLLMSYDYLRLYTNAFAFHATLTRALPQGADGKPISSRVFYNNVGAVGDARFIYEGLDAAKSVLRTVANLTDADTNLRYMPLRFYLYAVYAGVFLYRARTVGVLSPEEDGSVRELVSGTIARLQQASVGDQHPGTRYSQLLKLLWDKVEKKPRRENGSLATIIDPYRPGGIGTFNSQSGGTPSSTYMNELESPAVAERMGDFSWTDLDAVGNFAVNGNDGLMMAEGREWWAAGFLPADSHPFGSLGVGLGTGMDEWNMTM